MDREHKRIDRANDRPYRPGYRGSSVATSGFLVPQPRADATERAELKIMHVPARWGKKAPEPSVDQFRQMLEQALPIADERRKLVQQIRQALEHEDLEALIPLVRRLCGLTARVGVKK